MKGQVAPQKKRIMVMHACNPSTWKQKYEGCEFKVSLNYTMRSYITKNNKAIIMLKK
jgi:hypothetical protein